MKVRRGIQENENANIPKRPENNIHRFSFYPDPLPKTTKDVLNIPHYDTTRTDPLIPHIVTSPKTPSIPTTKNHPYSYQMWPLPFPVPPTQIPGPKKTQFNLFTLPYIQSHPSGDITTKTLEPPPEPPSYLTYTRNQFLTACTHIGYFYWDPSCHK